MDTNYVLGLVKRREEVIKVVTDRSIKIQGCAYSFITRIELLGFPKITQQEINGIESVLSIMQYIPLTTEIEDRAITLSRKYRLKIPDAIIAATAKCLNLELLTLDRQLMNRMKEILKGDE